MDLRFPEVGVAICDENIRLFLNDELRVEGPHNVIERLRQNFKKSNLDFVPKHRAHSSKWGYEYGQLSLNPFSNTKKNKGQYSIVWIPANFNRWKILSLTISY